MLEKQQGHSHGSFRLVEKAETEEKMHAYQMKAVR